MTNTQTLVKAAYEEHFRYLKEMADQVDALNIALAQIQDKDTQAKIEKIIKSLNTGIKEYSKSLENYGTQLYKKTA